MIAHKHLIGCAMASLALSACQVKNDELQEHATDAIDRQALVERHNPVVREVNPQSPFTVGNVQFAFTADVTGLQSLPGLYFEQGIPLETKARWAWHSRPNPAGYELSDTYEWYRAYGRQVPFPTDMDSAAGQWLRQNPHDLPLARIGLVLDGNYLKPDQVQNVEQSLDLWRGELQSRYSLADQPVAVQTVPVFDADGIAAQLRSPLLESARLAVDIRFPRGYDLSVKNTPAMLWQTEGHTTALVDLEPQSALFQRLVDNSEHWVQLHWQGGAELKKIAEHHYRLLPSGGEELAFGVIFNPDAGQEASQSQPPDYSAIAKRAADHWRDFWH